MLGLLLGRDADVAERLLGDRGPGFGLGLEAGDSPGFDPQTGLFGGVRSAGQSSYRSKTYDSLPRGRFLIFRKIEKSGPMAAGPVLCFRGPQHVSLGSDNGKLADAGVPMVGSAPLSCFGVVVKGGRARFPDSARPIRAVLAGSWKRERTSQSFRHGTAPWNWPLSNPGDVLASPRRRTVALSRLAAGPCAVSIAQLGDSARSEARPALSATGSNDREARFSGALPEVCRPTATSRIWCAWGARMGTGTLWPCVLRSQSESATQSACRGWAGRALSLESFHQTSSDCRRQESELR